MKKIILLMLLLLLVSLVGAEGVGHGCYEGIHTFKAYVQDMAGNVVSTETRTIYVDRSAPTLNIISPTNNTEFGVENIALNFTYKDCAVNWSFDFYCWYSVNGGENISLNCPSGSSDGNVTMSFLDNVTLVEGTNNLVLYANDSVGNVGSYSITLELTTGGDSCTCPEVDQNWEIDMSDYCNITEDCGLGIGTLDFTGAGETRCNATVNTTNMGDPGSNGVLYILENCLINIFGFGWSLIMYMGIIIMFSQRGLRRQGSVPLKRYLNEEYFK